MEIDLLAASGIGGALVAWLATYLWARREIERAARFGDRRLLSAEWAAEEYRREMEILRTRVQEQSSPADPGNGHSSAGQGNGHRANGDRANGDRANGDRANGDGANGDGARHSAHEGSDNGNGSGTHDNLKRIRGIGAVLERQLNELEVTTFRQIAAWRDEDIDRVAARLRVFSGRIRRDDWVEGARRAHREKYGDEPWQRE